MVNFDEENKALIESLVALGVLKTPRIIKAFLKVPRHLFIPKKYLSYAYKDIALPSLGSQTISQPYTVATMLEALSPDVDDNVLDIGSGTGWTTCLLAEIVGAFHLSSHDLERVSNRSRLVSCFGHRNKELGEDLWMHGKRLMKRRAFLHLF